MGWITQDAEEMSMALDVDIEHIKMMLEQIMSAQMFEALAELAECLSVKPEPRMKTTMQITTRDGERVSVVAARIPKRRTMRQHTAATGYVAI